MMADYGRFLSFLLGILITSTLLSISKIYFEINEPMIPSDHINFIPSVESIVDSRFKILAEDFQHEMQALIKDKVIMRLKDSEATNMDGIIGQYQHNIHKRQTNNTSKPKRPIYLENINSSCTFFYADYPDDNGKRGNYSSTGINRTNSKPIQRTCVNSSSICTFFHPDHPNAGLKEGNYSSNVTSEIMQDPTKVKGVLSCSKDPKLFGQLETEIWEKIEEIKTKTNISSKIQDEKIAKVMDWENKLANLLNQSMVVIKELKIQNTDQSKRIDQLEQKVAILQNSTKNSPSLTKSNIKDTIKNGTSNGNDVQKVSKALSPPSSCQELAMLEYYLDGLYLVKNRKTKKIQTVFCKFSAYDKVSESLIGQVDVKTKSVHFFVQRNIPLPDALGLIPFESVPLNEGGAFNKSSGSFIVPVPGIYHFHFSGVKYTFGYNANHLRIDLQVNDEATGISAENSRNSGSGSAGDVISLSASLRLAAGDRVNLYIVHGRLYNDASSYSHFTGWLVEEELM